MNQLELRKKLAELVGAYFRQLRDAGNIVWGKTKPVNPNSPMIALEMGPIDRARRPITLYVEAIPVNCYPAKTTLRIDMFTKGTPVINKPGIASSSINTALSDLTDFVNFLMSAHVDHWSYNNGISIQVGQDIQDLTQLINVTSWDYRAMVELEIGFTQNAVGYAGIMHEGGVPYHSNGRPKYDDEGYPLDEDGNRIGPQLPIGPDGRPLYPGYEANASGGGSQDLANQYTGWFEEVEIEYMKDGPQPRAARKA